jgi:hypothetical protein
MIPIEFLKRITGGNIPFGADCISSNGFGQIRPKAKRGFHLTYTP